MSKNAIVARLLLTMLLAVSSGGGAQASDQSATSQRPAMQPTASQQPTALDQYGGYLGLPISNSSGYFRTAQTGGKWWLVTPEGHAFYSLGVNSLNIYEGDGTSDSYYGRNFDTYTSFEQWNAQTAQRVHDDWHFNTVAGWSNQQMYHRGMPATLNLLFSYGNFPHINPVFPDVFDPAWTNFVTNTVNTLIPLSYTTDPWMMGYYIDGEIWWMKDGYYVDSANNSVVENFIQQPGSSYGKRAWVEYLRGRYATVASLNAAWQSSFSSFTGTEPSSVASTTQVTTNRAAADKSAFLALVADQYYRVTATAVRARAPHQLVLGDRMLGVPFDREVFAAAGRWLDVLTIDIYSNNPTNPTLHALDKAVTDSNKPLLIAEMGYRTWNSGQVNNPPLPGAALSDEDARADAYRIYLGELLRRPAVVGMHWFKLSDDPVMKRGPQFGGYYGWGLVNINNQPYTRLTDRIAAYNADVYPRRLQQPVVNLEPPLPIYPTYAGASLGSTVDFRWRAVNGAISYTLQLARTPSFSSSITVRDALTSTSHSYDFAQDWGRWYWRVRVNSSSSDYLAYTAAQPFDVLQPVNETLISGFESPEEVNLIEQGGAARWARELTATFSLTATQGGATQGQQAGLLTFSGDYAGGSGYGSYASLYRLPNYGNFSPRNISGYDYLSLDVTNPESDTTSSLFYASLANDSGTDKRWESPLRSGLNRWHLPLSEASARIDLSAIGNLKLGLRLPHPGQQVIVDNLRLTQVRHDAPAQPPVNLTASDAAISGTLALDWASYRPATSTVAYHIYVTDTAGVNVTSLLPALTLDAATQYSLLKFANPAAPLALLNAKTWYVAVTAVDLWGNESSVGAMQPVTPTECGSHFADIGATSWALHYVSRLACQGVVGGLSDGNFHPNDTTTRAQFTKMIVTVLGWPLLNPATPSFPDVQPDYWAYRYIETARAYGVVGGKPDGNFHANDYVTRAELAKLIVRAAGWPLLLPTTATFADVPFDHWAASYIEAAASWGVVNGTGGGNYSPGATGTRAQLSKMLWLAIHRPLGNPAPTFALPPPYPATIFHSDPIATTVVSGSLVILKKELSAFANYGNPSGNADIIYGQTQADWNFDLPTTITPGMVLTAEWLLAGALDDHSSLPTREYSGTVLSNGQISFAGRFPFTHGQGSRFNNWAVLSLPVSSGLRQSGNTLRLSSSASDGAHWVGVDWVQLVLHLRQ